jgi:hypothetical protein
MGSIKLWVEEKIAGPKIRSVWEQAARSQNKGVKWFYDLVMRNKFEIGAAFVAAWSWAKTGCMTLLIPLIGQQIDVVSYLQISGHKATCAGVTEFLGIFGWALMVSGITPSDPRAAIIQGVMKPNGAANTPPAAPVLPSLPSSPSSPPSSPMV